MQVAERRSSIHTRRSSTRPTYLPRYSLRPSLFSGIHASLRAFFLRRAIVLRQSRTLFPSSLSRCTQGARATCCYASARARQEKRSRRWRSATAEGRDRVSCERDLLAWQDTQEREPLPRQWTTGEQLPVRPWWFPRPSPAPPCRRYSLSHSISLALCLNQFILTRSFSLAHSLSLSPPPILSLSLPFSLSFSLSRSLALSLFLSLYVCLSLSLSLSLSLPTQPWRLNTNAVVFFVPVCYTRGLAVARDVQAGGDGPRQGLPALVANGGGTDWRCGPCE